ncbi:MAG: hypothetical protein IJ660_03085 [Alphaproteobacteria bacterium]|nr:hypothetical protein [Alphaproteobacteria bacterium]
MIKERLSSKRLKDLLYYNRDLQTKHDTSVGAVAVRTEIAEVIEAIATNRSVFTDTDKRLSYKLAETLIREAGYDAKGIYSEAARAAMTVLCQKQGTLPYRRPLIDKKRSFTQRLKDRFVGAAQKYLFKQDCVENDGNVIISPSCLMNKGFYQAQIIRMEQQRPSKLKTLWQNSRKYAAGFVFAAASLFGLGGDGQGKTVTVSLSPIPQKSSRTASKDTLHKILEHKTVYFNSVKQQQNHQLYDNYYNTYLEMRLNGKKNLETFYQQIQSKIDQKIFKLENGITLPRFAHALYLSRIYENNSIIQEAMKRTSTLLPAQQKRLSQYFIEIGKKGEKLQSRHIQKYGAKRTNEFSQFPQHIQQKHLENLHRINTLN